MTRFHSEALGKRARTTFASGNETIDAYFRTMVSQDVRRRYAACFVLLETDGGALAGFYTLSSCMVALDDVPDELARKLPRYPMVPAVLIGWLGRDLAFRGAGIGELLLQDAIARVARAEMGVHALVADAIDGAADAFYRANGFMSLAGRRLFLPMATAVRARSGRD